MVNRLVPEKLTASEMFEYLSEAAAHYGVLVATDYRPHEVWITLPKFGWRIKTRHKNSPYYRQLVRLPDHSYLLTWPDNDDKYYLYRVSHNFEMELVKMPEPAATE